MCRPWHRSATPAAGWFANSHPSLKNLPGTAAGDVEPLLRAEDLHVAPVITWWNNSNPWAKEPLPPNSLVRLDGNRYYFLAVEGCVPGFSAVRQRRGLAAPSRRRPTPLQLRAAGRTGRRRVRPRGPEKEGAMKTRRDFVRSAGATLGCSWLT
jgi:hypothetical protein